MTMTQELEIELRAAGYDDKAIEKERSYLERVANENEYFRAKPSREWIADHGQEDY